MSVKMNNFGVRDAIKFNDREAEKSNREKSNRENEDKQSKYIEDAKKQIDDIITGNCEYYNGIFRYVNKDKNYSDDTKQKIINYLNRKQNSTKVPCNNVDGKKRRSKPKRRSKSKKRSKRRSKKSKHSSRSRKY